LQSPARQTTANSFLLQSNKQWLLPRRATTPAPQHGATSPAALPLLPPTPLHSPVQSVPSNSHRKSPSPCAGPACRSAPPLPSVAPTPLRVSTPSSTIPPAELLPSAAAPSKAAETGTPAQTSPGRPRTRVPLHGTLPLSPPSPPTNRQCA